MLDYWDRTVRKRTAGNKLLGTLEADNILLYTPLLRWYLEHGLELQAVYTTIEYRPKKILAWFVEQVTKARGMGDIDKEKTILAEAFKLLGNSSYGKLIWKDTQTSAILKTKKLWAVCYGRHISRTSLKLAMRMR